MESLARRTELRSEDEVRAALRRAVRRADVDTLLVVRRRASFAVDDLGKVGFGNPRKFRPREMSQT